jgi:geranylgeranyl diphosphate synthase type II
MAPLALDEYLEERKVLIDRALEARLPAGYVEPKQVHQAMRYATLGGGKRLRPILSIAVAELAGAPPERVLDAACAIELVHGASLILDDLPAMDNAPSRRNQPCTHTRYGEATAILASVGLIAHGFDLVVRNAETIGRGVISGTVVRHLARVIGTEGIIFGQHVDLSMAGRVPSVSELEQVYRHKAAALFLAAITIPAHFVDLNESETQALEQYAHDLGLAFQITDDLIDAPGATGRGDKTTFSTHLGHVGARDKAGDLIASAVQTLAPFGDRAEPLRHLAHYVGTRTF